jgi:hypothetical protein
MIEAVEPTEFLAVPAGFWPAVEEKNLKKMAKYFPPAEPNQLITGSWYYVVFKVNATKFGYLARLLQSNEEGAWFQHVADAHLVSGTNKEDEKVCTKLNFKDGKFQEKVYAVPTDPEPLKDQHQAPSFPFETWIKEDPSVKRLKIDKSERVSMLSQAAAKAVKVLGTDPAKWPEDEAEIVKVCSDSVEDVTAEALDALQAASADGGKERDAPTFGNKPSNALIVARAVMRMFEANSEPSKPAERHSNRELANLSRQVDRLSQQIELLASGPAKQAEVEGKKHVEDGPAKHVENEKDKVELFGMVGNGECAYQLPTAVLEICRNAETDLSKIAELGAKQVDQAREYLIRNFISMLKLVKDFGKEIGAFDSGHFANAQWQAIMGESTETILNEVLDGKEWGGIIEQALALWHSHVEIVVMLADSINAKSTDKQVRGAIHPAMLGGLPLGPVTKTMRVFAILKQKHYYLAATKQGGSMRAMFKIGSEADEAQDLIVAHLKSKSKAPLGELDEAERSEAIKEAFKSKADGASYAGKTATAEAAAKKAAAAAGAAKPAADAAKPAKSNTPCRNFEKHGNCSYGEKCNFKHDDSRKARNKRANNQKQANRPIAVVKAKDQQQSGWQQVPSRERLLKVRCRASVRPANWRSSLRSINPAAHELVTWVGRNVADEEWLTVQCKVGEEDKLSKLLAQHFEIKQQSRRPNTTGKQRTHHCADFLNGKNRCNHPAPYCM